MKKLFYLFSFTTLAALIFHFWPQNNLKREQIDQVEIKTARQIGLAKKSFASFDQEQVPVGEQLKPDGSIFKSELESLLMDREDLLFAQAREDLRSDPHGVSPSILRFSKKLARLMAMVTENKISENEMKTVSDYLYQCSLGRGSFSGLPESLEISCMVNLARLVQEKKCTQEDLNDVISQSSPRKLQIYEFLRPHQSRGT